MPILTDVTPTKRITCTLLAAAALTLGVGGVAQARPVPDTIVTPADLGPGAHPDWWCVYSDTYGESVCTYVPGAHRPLKPVMRKAAKHLWNPWTWF